MANSVETGFGLVKITGDDVNLLSKTYCKAKDVGFSLMAARFLEKY